jgi:hypothetical protein
MNTSCDWVSIVLITWNEDPADWDVDWKGYEERMGRALAKADFNRLNERKWAFEVYQWTGKRNGSLGYKKEIQLPWKPSCAEIEAAHEIFEFGARKNGIPRMIGKSRKFPH